MFNREKIGAAAQDIANHLHLVDHVKALQDQQKTLAQGLADLSEKLRDVQLEMRSLKSETKLEALKEAQGVVFAVQGGLNQRIEDLAVQVGVMRASAFPAPMAERPRRPNPELETVSTEADVVGLLKDR